MLNLQKHDPENLHFTDEQWTDFVRGIAQEPAVTLMRTHLASGCPDCNATVRLLDALTRAGLPEGELHVPEAVVQRAREIFTPPPPAPGQVQTWQTIAAQLIREASLTWQPAGVRSPGDNGPGAGERKMFRAGDYIVDLQVEAPSSDKAAEIVGQIANENDAEDSLGGIIVEMVIPGRTLTGTSTNRFGEFVLECPAVENAVLRIALRERRQRIELPLNLRV
ncbi:MAG: hypothetical protein JO307_08905 [Bryobacterales bacterium]|nr:hypothetical protein [Bryobacterales bacterium]MBV9396749.1 hypothetical protein [Bryobacterales bacterium]